VPVFKAIELDSLTRRRTGREHVFDVDTRQAAIDSLLARLGEPSAAARVDPTRTMVEIGSERLWTLVRISASRPDSPSESSSLRRGGAKHRRVR
jgi:hypothetical protein